jgi:hypothetical protein
MDIVRMYRFQILCQSNWLAMPADTSSHRVMAKNEADKINMPEANRPSMEDVIEDIIMLTH